MKKPMLPAACGLLCLLALSACATEAGSPASSAVQAPSPSLTPGAALSPEVSPILAPAPLTEEDVRSQFEADGSYSAISITPYGNDYLVEAVSGTGGGGWYDLYWVFGDSGRRVWLNCELDFEEIASYRITGPGTVEITTTGQHEYYQNYYKPSTYTVAVAVDSQGRLLPDYETQQSVVLWEHPSHGGWLLLDDPGLVSGKPYFSGRYEQIYQLRIGINDISLSFIPSSAPGRFQTFFPASTSAPTSDCSFDPETRVFTIRLYNTALESGVLSDADIEWMGADSVYLPLYPRSIPAGDLGQGNHFIESASISQDGEDAVIALTLTDASYAYQTESGNMGCDDFPFLRYSFREQDYRD